MEEIYLSICIISIEGERNVSENDSNLLEGAYGH